MSALEGKNILITGGTGFIGKFLCEQFLQKYPDINHIYIVSRDEYKQTYLEEEFGCKYDIKKFSCLLADIRDREAIFRVCKGVDIVIHTAALKQVLRAENFPDEYHKTNVIGTKNLLDACRKYKVGHFLHFSTDKAVQPKGVYGYTKRDAEHLVTDFHKNINYIQILRLGNILGSRGSVIPVLAKKNNGNIIKISDPYVTRFGLMLEELWSYVKILLTGFIDIKGVFIPKSASFNLKQLIDVFFPEKEIQYKGLHPAEKLHECLLNIASNEQMYLAEDMYLLPFRKDKKINLKNMAIIHGPFQYQSDKNDHWLSPDLLRKMKDNIMNDSKRNLL